MKTYKNGVPVWWLLVLMAVFVGGAMVGVFMTSSATNCGLTVFG